MYRFGCNNLFRKAELVKGIWIGNGKVQYNSNAYCWVIPCKANTSYAIVREKSTTRGVVGSTTEYPKVDISLSANAGISSNSINYKTKDNDKYLIIYFTVNNIEIDKKIKWIVKEAKK